MISYKKFLLKTTLILVGFPVIMFTETNKPVKAHDPYQWESNDVEESKGFYFTSNFGTSSINSANWKATISDLDYKGDVKFKSGIGWEAGAGYDFGTLRTEITFSKSQNDISSISALINEGDRKGTTAEANASGELKVKNIFINSYLDFPIGEKKKIIPYFGGGIGGTNLKMDKITVVNEEVESAEVWLFGYQAKLGLGYSVSQNFEFFGESIYSGFSDLGVAGDKYGLSSKSDFNYKAGLRIRF